MDEDQREKENKNPSGESPGNIKKKRAPRVFKEPKNLPKTCGEGYRKRALPSTTDLLPKKKVTFGEKSEWMPSFNNYEDFSQKTLKSSDGFMIILNKDGLIVSATTHALYLLGHTPEEIKGKTLLDLIPDQEKNNVLEKIFLCIPLSNSVGKHITFGCHLRRNVEYGCGSAYQYANIILNVIDISTESVLYFSRIYQSQYDSDPYSLLLEDKFYLVGFVCVIRSQILRELCNVKEEKEVDAAKNLDKYTKRRFLEIEDGSKTFKTEAVCADPEASISSDLVVAVTVEKTGQHTSSSTSTDSSAYYQESTSEWRARERHYLCALDLGELIKTEKMHQKSKTEMKDLKPEEIAVPMKVKEKQHMEKQEAEQVRAMECAEQAEPMDQADKKMGPAEEPKENMSMEEVEAFVPSNKDPIQEAEWAIECVEQAEPVDQADKKTGLAEEPKENMSMEEVEAFVPMKEDPIEETEPGTMEEPKEAEMKAMSHATPIDESFMPVTASIATIWLALEDTTKVLQDNIRCSEETLEETKKLLDAMKEPTLQIQLQDDIQYSEETLEETMKLLEAMTEPTLESQLQDDIQYSEETLEETKKLLEAMKEPTLESQISTPGPFQSSASQALEAVTPNGKQKPDSDVHKSKNSCALSPFHTITSEKLGESCDISTQVQFPKAEPQDPPSTGAAQDPADITADILF